MEQLTKRAYGKINLALDVLQKRPDGYHELRTVMQAVGIYDELTFVKRADREIHITLAKSGCFIRRAITDYGNAQRPVIIRLVTMRCLYGRCLRKKGYENSYGTHTKMPCLRCAYDDEFAL